MAKSKRSTAIRRLLRIRFCTLQELISDSKSPEKVNQSVRIVTVV